ncbi:MAG: hypothetical protein M0P27_02140 [Bacteroidales bacterium]|nr:hypothetical protein [Bacteroidales bacterium]
MKDRFTEAIYKSKRTVFKLKDIGMLTNNRNADNLKASVNYYVSRGVVSRVRKGVYVKDPYQPEELAGRIYSPSYISLETVLVKAGVIFQYSSAITAVSYLSRTIVVDDIEISYNKIKNSIIVDGRGTISENNINMATPERAFIDRLYLSKNYYFDNILTATGERLLAGAGSISHAHAVEKAKTEYVKYQARTLSDVEK